MTVEYLPSIGIPSDGILYGYGEGRAFSRRSIREGSRRMLKLRSPWGNMSDESIYASVDAWRVRWPGFPSSPGLFFHQIFHVEQRADQAWSRYIRGGYTHLFGPPRVITTPCWLYDLKSAYQHAARSIAFPGAWKRACRSIRLGLWENDRVRDDAPRFYGRAGVVLVDEQDVEQYRLSGRWISGVTWSDADAVQLGAALDEMRSIMPPDAWDLGRKRFWGAWLSRGHIRCEFYRAGALVRSWELPSRYYNPIYATLIVHAVTRRVWAAAAKTAPVSMYIDSILTTAPMETGPDMGQWVEKGYYSEGVRIRAPGVWSALPEPDSRALWTRHAGTQNIELQEAAC